LLGDYAAAVAFVFAVLLSLYVRVAVAVSAMFILAAGSPVIK